MGDFNFNLPSGIIQNKHFKTGAETARAFLALETLKFNQPLESLRIFDSATNAVLPNTAASDDLGLILGVFGTSDFVVETSNARTTTVTQKARFRFELPHNYEPDGTIQIVAWAGMKTTISDGTATIDFNVYRKDPSDGTVGSDLVTTAATTINNLTAAAKTFDITSTNIDPGDELTAMVTIAITDTATPGNVFGRFTKLYWQLGVRG